MSKFAIRLLTLAMYATALAAPMVTSSKAAAETSKAVKKSKKIHRSSSVDAPRPSSQARPNSNNPYDDPDRKVSY
jgi:Ni/Co efflux regulator RcnB